ncbi:MAG TPA: hypothetical protein VLL04_14025, partial [Rhizomicrobium sp.]|nr:hypothetical protein [Rhizomicrobium sp.]
MSELPTPRAVAAKSDTLTPKFMAAVIAGVVVSGLYFGRPVLMPLALAVLMSFALAPLVGLLKRLRLGNIAPVLISLLLAVVVLSSRRRSWARNWPNWRRTCRATRPIWDRR